MISHNLLIGSVSLVLGAAALGTSLANYNGLFQLAKMRMLEESIGRDRARLACGLLGCGLIVIGGLILTGVLPRKWSLNHDAQRSKTYAAAIA